MSAWIQKRLSAAIVAGGQSLSCYASDVDETPVEPAGGLVPAADGTTAYQTHQERERPLSVRQEISLEFIVSEESDYFILRRLLGLAALAPLELFVDVPIEETWEIATTRTLWTMRRSTAVDLAPIAIHEPRAFVGAVELARSATSPPGAGEFYVDSAARAATIETLDLSASAGEILSLRYHPLRLLGQVEVTFAHTDEDNGLWTVGVVAQEHLA